MNRYNNLPAADDHSHVAALLRRLGPLQRKYYYLCEPYLTPDTEAERVAAIREITSMNAIELVQAISAMSD